MITMQRTVGADLWADRNNERPAEDVQPYLTASLGSMINAFIHLEGQAPSCPFRRIGALLKYRQDGACPSSLAASQARSAKVGADRNYERPAEDVQPYPTTLSGNQT